MKKGIRCILVVLLVSILTLAPFITAAAIGDAKKPCVEFQGGNTYKVRVGSKIRIKMDNGCQYTTSTSGSEYYDVESLGEDGGWLISEVTGLKKGTVTVTFHSQDERFTDAVLTIKVIAKAGPAPTPVPSSPFVLTDEFAAKLTAPTNGDTAIALTTDGTKFTGADGTEKKKLPSGLWAKTASDDKGQLLSGDPEHPALLEDGYADPKSVTVVALPADVRTVTASSLWGRARPNSNYKPLFIIRKGDEVYYLADDGFWALVLTKDGHAAYVAMKYLSGTTPEATPEATPEPTPEVTAVG